MSDEDRRPKDIQMSPSCSSFEAQDPHDPVISRLATNLFREANNYLDGELSSFQEFYSVLEELNRLTHTKYADLRSLAVNIRKLLHDHNGKYNDEIKPLLAQVDAVDEMLSWFEAQVMRIDAYTKQLHQRFREIEERR